MGRCGAGSGSTQLGSARPLFNGPVARSSWKVRLPRRRYCNTATRLTRREITDKACVMDSISQQYSFDMGLGWGFGQQFRSLAAARFDKFPRRAQACRHEFRRRPHCADYYHHSENGGLARDRNSHSHPPHEAGFLWPPLPGKSSQSREPPHANRSDRHRIPARQRLAHGVPASDPERPDLRHCP